MSRILRFTLGCLAAAVLLSGCSSDTPTDPQARLDQIKTMIAGQIEAGATAFEVTAPAPGDPSPGSFLIQGSNLRYEADPGMLVADLVLVNDSSVDFPGPARLVFLQLLPAGVTVLNADNADTALAAGAWFEFAFADADTVWRAGAATEPRTVQFGVAPGVSVGFVARILVGDDPVGGAIGGLVWHDRNADGLFDEGEPGVADVDLTLRLGAATEPLLLVTTDATGAYRFPGLAAGHYTVGLADADGLVPTTAPSMEVLLVEVDGQVMDFLEADFGVTLADTLACLEVGACLHAKGAYAGEPDRLDAWQLNVCGYEDDDDDDCEEGEENKFRDGQCWGRLTGPITAVDAELGAIAVMGTWVELPAEDWAKCAAAGDLEVGVRVRVHAEVVTGEDGDHVVACRVHRWHGHADRVRGQVQEVVREGDTPVAVRVLNTLITVPEGFTCDDGGDHDDGDHDDGDHDDGDNDNDDGDNDDGDHDDGDH